MRNIVNAAFVAATLLSTSLAAQAAQPLLPAGPQDQVPTRLVSAPVPSGEFEHRPVTFSWALDPHAPLTPPAPLLAESREYWQTVDGAELQRGVAVRTTAPGALIRVSPTRGSHALDAHRIVVAGNGKNARLEQIAGAEDLRAAGMEVGAGTAIVKLAADNPAGDYALRSPEAQGQYLIHVFEPGSDVVLTAQNSRHHVLGGETLAVSMQMARGNQAIRTQAEALLVAPDGSSRPVAVQRDANGLLTARVRPPLQASNAPGLWELQLFATGDGVSRDTRTAFGVAAPTARLDGDAAVDARRLSLQLPVRTAAPGRYEVRGVLYATGADGALAPVSEAHSAAWLDRGKGSLELAFDPSHVPSGYGAPYEVRQLELNDQTRMAPLEQRARALRF